MKIAIIDIIGIPYDGTTVFKQGLGGSESAVTLMAMELQNLNFEVTVFNNCSIDHAQPGVYDGVTYRPLSDLAQDHVFDIVISSRTVIPFVDPNEYDKLRDNRAMPFHGMNLYDRILSKAKMRILWMHDTFCLGDLLIEDLANANRITDIFTLSDFHLSYVGNCDHGKRRNFEVLKRKFFITRNGARNYNTEVDITAKDPNLFVYNASVTKGMIPLVEHIWPRVKQHIPQAQLKIIGGYYRFSSGDAPDEQEKKWRQMADDVNNPQKGIEFTGIIPQHEIAEILSKSNFMIYPSAFPETYGISTLESLMYNTPVITCRFGALEEIAIEGACYHVDYAIEPNGLFPNINVPAQVEKFVKVTLDAYHNKYLHQQKQYYCNIIKDVAGWDSVALQWKQLFFKKTGNYLSVEEYREASRINHKVHTIWKRRFHNEVELESYKSGTEQEIVIISPFYNCAHYIAKCIDSVATQDYNNYRHILIDDCSTDNSADVAEYVISQLPEELQSKFTLIRNSSNQGAVKNQIDTIRTLNDNAIVMLLDGDDTLVNDNTILSYYNTTYDEYTEFTYGSCWSMVDNIPLISQPYPERIKQSGNYRNHHFNWILPYTHFRTFKKHLVNNIDDSMFQDSQGAWYKAGGDGSVFYALIEAADPDKVKCLQDVVYNYNDINPLNDYKVNGEEQNKTARDIIGKTRTIKYSVIVPTMWRVAEQFVNFVGKLCEHKLVGEIIIINNDNSKTPATGLDHPKIKMLDFNRNIFVNPAWNIGVNTSTNDRLCIVNDDVVFDTDVFDRLKNILNEHNGVFGLCPGEPDFDQTPITTKTIDIVPWGGEHTYGFGCLMFINKKNWVDIPGGLDIYYGDNFIFDLQLSQDKTNYSITNMDFYSQFAATTSDITITGGRLDKETPIYNQIRSQMHKIRPVVPAPVIEPIPVIRQKRILIGIPTAKNIESETFKSIYDLEIPDGYVADFQCFFGYQVDQVRNLIADWVVKGYDYLLAIDSDIGFEKNILKKLLAHDKDIVTGMYIQRRQGMHVLELYDHNGRGGVSNIPYEKLNGRGLVEIAGCGFGCVLVKAEVFRTVGYPQFEYHSAIDHAHTISEDNDFCHKARNKGFRIWVDTTIQCKHIGSFTYQIDNNIPAIAEINPTTSIQDRLRFIGDHLLMQEAHVKYLATIRDQYKYTPMVAYDIGACVLHWTNAAKTVWPDAEYVAFDALAAAEFLYQEARMKYNIGVLSDVDGKEIDFYQNEHDPAGNSYYRENSELSPGADILYTEAHKRRFKTMTLDSVVIAKKLPLPDLIKIDVQGAELDVLRGAEQTLKTAKHVILELQVVEYNKGAPLHVEVIAYMDSIGYECMGIFCNNGPDGDYHFVRR